ncbi:unnamed protein product [Paramecium pentaurelia]|uniref:Midasin n=1 Tax=Paramecium pentaurelia TaxID=43138 RepID=A0A8S1W577_9CILI|nr:unnamed protein product [Paramecium pentaurelia]
MENWNLIRQECKDQSESVIAYLFQRFPSLRNLLKSKILNTLPNSYLVCYVLDKCTPIGDSAFALNLKALQGILIAEPEKRLFLEKEFYDQRLKNRQIKHIFAITQQNKRINTGNEIQVDKIKLNELTYMLDQTNFVIICGPFGCGKTTLLKYYFELHKQKELTLYMDETIDFQSLVGQFVCTEQIGVFTHKAGPLLFCENIGAYLVMKNYSETSEDFKQQLRRALQLKYVEVNGQKKDISNLKVIALQKDVIEDQYVIIMEPINFEILKQINCRYFKEILEWYQNTQQKPELKDLYKLKNRFQYHLKDYQDQIYIPEQVRNKLCLECWEVLKVDLSQVFQLDQLRQTTYLQRYDHYLEFSKLGQIEINQDYQQQLIVYNQYSSRIMEQIMTCILNDEACLLVGDTGCGKTTLTQHCAQLLGKKLHIYNLSEGSDCQDLIGGFRPLNQETLIKINYTKFLKYFTRTVDSQKNQQFINSLQKLYATKKFNMLVKCMIETTQQCLTKVNDNKLKEKMNKLMKNLKSSVQEMSFYFLTGNFIKAMQKGDWVLIDEINLANNELLQKILPAIEKTQLLFYERGDENPIKIHPNFRIFGCMNPGTDVGKKELPPNIKNKFSTIFCHELLDKQDIIDFIKGLIGHSFDVVKLADLYLNLKDICKKHQFNLQTFSLRNLARALHYFRSSKQKNQNLSMFNGLSLAFGSGLGKDSQELFHQQLQINGLDYKQFTPSINQQNYRIFDQYVEIYGFQLPRGYEQPISPDKCEYLITPSNFGYLLSCLRCISGTGIPILLEGPTSGGKTSLIYFIAKICGQRCHRINNHQNTQLEEYFGTYSQVGNSIQFVDGLLVTAMRRGDWIILDELNLARSEILENLNRLLDDNQELFLPETQTTLKPHPGFRIFGTQNPVTYSGRKQLSKAFRNRFIEIQVEEISTEDLTNILKTRCQYLPETHIPLVRQTQVQINLLRASESLFMGMVTLRDLIKWGNRMKTASSGKESTAMEGYCLIVERVRDIQLRKQLQTIIENIFKVKLHPEEYYMDVLKNSGLIEFSTKYNIQWNQSFIRMTALTLKSIQNNEPALLVGPPGIGKTTLTTIIADKLNLQNQHIVCHQYLELSDFVGALRPTRDSNSTSPFQFQDGPLLKCFKEGGVFLIDEVNMCPESVLEGLNSCLEQPATLTVNDQFYQAHKTFVIIAAMNPSGDWGKKELTPALRSRFTEIFVFNPLSKNEMHSIVQQFEQLHCNTICDTLLSHEDMTFRDLLQIVEHIKKLRQTGYSDEAIIIQESIDFALDQVTQIRNNLYSNMELEQTQLIPEINAYKLLRAVNIHNKPIMIQGPPQCGKTHIIQYFAKLRGIKCVKIIFDEQSDLQELLGTDQPNSSLDQISKLVGYQVSSEQSNGQFRFVPGPLLEGLKKGYWVILKNLNLAPQNVLEGLNSILDHRREIFIPELGQIIQVHQDCKLFAIQNPMTCGEGRKGLPLSFLNRFIKIEFQKYSEEFKVQICPSINLPLAALNMYNLLSFNQALRDKLLINSTNDQITSDHIDSTLWAQQRIHFSDLINSVSHLRSVLIVGDKQIGKKYLIERVAKYCNQQLVNILLSKQTDSMELLGQYVQGDQDSLFKWQFSRLVEAAINGEWVLIDSPSRELFPKLSQFIEEDHFTLFGIDIPINNKFKIFITTEQLNLHHNVKLYMQMHNTYQFKLSYYQDIRRIIYQDFEELYDHQEIVLYYYQKQNNIIPQQQVIRMLQKLRIQIESILLTQDMISQYEIQLLLNQIFSSQENIQNSNLLNSLINFNILFKIDNPIIEIKDCPLKDDNPIIINQIHNQSLIKRIIREHNNIYLEYFSYGEQSILQQQFDTLLSTNLQLFKENSFKLKESSNIQIPELSNSIEGLIQSIVKLKLLQQLVSILQQQNINYTDVKLYEFMLRQKNFEFQIDIDLQNQMIKTIDDWKKQEIFDYIIFDKRMLNITEDIVQLKCKINILSEQLRESENLKEFVLLLKQCLQSKPLAAIDSWVSSLLKSQPPLCFNEFPLISDQLSVLNHYRKYLTKEVNFENKLNIDIYQLQTLYNYQKTDLIHQDLHFVLKYVQFYIDYLNINPKVYSSPLKICGNDQIQTYIEYLKNSHSKVDLSQTQQILLQGLLQAQLFEIPFYKSLLNRFYFSRSQHIYYNKKIEKTMTIEFFQKIIDLTDDDLMKLSSNEIQLIILQLFQEQLEQAQNACFDSQYLLKGYYQEKHQQLSELLESTKLKVDQIKERLFIRDPFQSNLEATMQFIQDLKQALLTISKNMNKQYIEAWIIQSYDKYYYGFKDFLQPIYESLMFIEYPIEPTAQLSNSGFKYQLRGLKGQNFIKFSDQQLISQEERDVFKMDDAKLYILLSRKIKGLVVEQYNDNTVENEQKQLEQQLKKELNQYREELEQVGKVTTDELKHNVREELSQLDILSKEFLDYILELESQNKNPLIITKMFGRFIQPTLSISDDMHIDAFLYKLQFNKLQNVYKQTDQDEITKATDLLMKILIKIKSIQEDDLFAENEVIQSMGIFIVHLLKQNAYSTPLIKMITGIELLLEKIELWDKTVPKEFKIYGYDLQNLVIKWRKIERDGWKYILANKIQELWCVESIILFKLLRDLTHNSLKTYLNECDIGVFEIRIIMLRQILKYLNLQQRQLISQHIEQSSIFIETYNQQLGSTVQGYIKEVAEYRKLVSWESKNYIIVQQTSHKMHGKLIKVQGRFRAYLNEKLQKVVIKIQLQDEFTDCIDGFLLKSKQFQQKPQSNKSFHSMLQNLIEQSLERVKNLKEQKSNSKLAALKNFQEYISTFLGLKMHQSYKEDNYLLQNEAHPLISKASFYYYKAISVMEQSALQIGKYVPPEYSTKSFSLILDYIRKLNHQFKLIRPLIKIENESISQYIQVVPQDYLNCFKDTDIYDQLNEFNKNQDELSLSKLLDQIESKFHNYSDKYENSYHILKQLHEYLLQIKINDLKQNVLNEEKQQVNQEKIQIVYIKYMKNLEQEENLLAGEIKILNSFIKHGIDQSKLNLVIKNLEYSCKFLYFMTSILCNIIVKGFCQKDDDQDENGEDNPENFQAGTGIGEGKGEQNVTKEIEYEEQLLGEQKQQQQQQPEEEEQEQEKEKDKKEDAFDMKNDFDGQNQEQSKDEENEEEEQEQEKNSMDEGFSSVNEDNEDMKQYQGSEEEEDEQNEDESKSNRKKSDIEFNADEEKDDKKIQAKEEREQKQNNQKRNMKDLNEDSHNVDSQMEEEEQDGDEENEESIEDSGEDLKDYAGKGGEQLESMDEEDVEELNNNQSQNQDQENISMNEEENPNPDEMPIEEEIKFDEPNMEQEPEKQDINEDIMQKQAEQLEKQDMDNIEQEQDQNQNQLFTNQQDVENQLNDQAQDQGQQGEEGTQDKDENDKKQKEQDNKNKKQREQGEDGGDSKLEMIKKLFDAMEQHLTKEDMDNFKKDLNVHDSEQEENDNEDAIHDNDYKVSKDQIQHKRDNTTNLPTKFQQNETQDMKREGEENKEKGQGKSMDEEKVEKKEEQEKENQENMNQSNKEFIIPQPIEIENKNQSDIPIEEYIKQYFRLGYDVNGDINLQKGLEMWPKLQQEVLESSIHLCEELKSILIATQVSALKGDYKTGKRLNMKKIIPYIASNYRKDKIWLRRTQPQKRTFQILLALDDSLSMSENQVGYLSLQSLTSLSLALSKMEAGQIGIASIHEGMRLLHDFNKPFTQLDCPFILGQFNFEFESKQSSELSLMRFMRESIDQFKNIRVSNAQQICFIMSDGKFNKKMVRPLVREAEELQIFYVFIILDREDQSITNIKSTHYVTVNDKQKIEIRNYLEDFPFRYYIIIKSPHELNHVLVNILRQYYQLLE